MPFLYPFTAIKAGTMHMVRLMEINMHDMQINHATQPLTKTPPLHDRVPRILSGICCGLASCILFFLSLQFLINNVPLSALSSPAPTSRIRQTNKREQFISDDVQRANERISKGRRIQIESLALGPIRSYIHLEGR